MWSTVQIQTVAIVAQTLVFALQTVVLSKTLSAVKKQATAANAQANAAENQANVSIQQVYANMAQADEALRPLLSLENTDGRLQQNDGSMMTLRNNGLGPALRIRAFLEEKAYVERQFERYDIPLLIDFLGKGNSTEFWLPVSPAQNLVIEYESTMRSIYETRYAFGEDGDYHQTTFLKKRPYDDLATIPFKSYFSDSPTRS